MTLDKAINRDKAHTENVFELHLVHKLVSDQDYRERLDTDYNKALALDTELVIEFVKSTQPEVWRALENKLGAKCDELLCKEIDRSLKAKGILTVLREGVQFTWSPTTTKLCYFNPASNINPNLDALYQKNILSVMRQVHYSYRNNNTIDAGDLC